MQATYISPLTDFGFKKRFGEELSKYLLISFLNNLLPDIHQKKKQETVELTGLSVEVMSRRKLEVGWPSWIVTLLQIGTPPQCSGNLS